MAFRFPPRGDPWWTYLVSRRRPSVFKGQLIAIGFASVSAATWFLLRSVLPGAPFNTFFPFLIVATVFGGRRAGITLMLLGLAFAVFIWTNLRPVAPLAGVIAALAFLVLGSITIGIIHALQTLVTALEKAERQADVMAGEMRHRVGNLMQLVEAIARMTARSSQDLGQFMTKFEGRLRALSEAHNLSSGNREMPGNVGELVRILMSAYEPERFLLSGPLIALDANAALRLALVIHELATNAAKYGAMSTPAGLVRIDWYRRDDDIEFSWREEGGPLVSPPTRLGFGSRLIQATVAAGGGQAKLGYEPAGVECVLQLPAEQPPFRGTHS